MEGRGGTYPPCVFASNTSNAGGRILNPPWSRQNTPKVWGGVELGTLPIRAEMGLESRNKVKEMVGVPFTPTHVLPSHCRIAFVGCGCGSCLPHHPRSQR